MHEIDESMQKKMMLEIVLTHRKILLRHREYALDQVQQAIQKLPFDDLMFAIMAYAFWLRADLELLLRVAFWQNLSEKQMGSRILYDQQDLVKVTLNRIGISAAQTSNFIKEFKKIADYQDIKPVAPEKNTVIITKLTYRKEHLKKLHDLFYKLLTKYCHPDPLFMYFPFPEQVKTNLMKMFTKCARELDNEWHMLETHLKKPF